MERRNEKWSIDQYVLNEIIVGDHDCARNMVNHETVRCPTFDGVRFVVERAVVRSVWSVVWRCIDDEMVRNRRNS